MKWTRLIAPAFLPLTLTGCIGGSHVLDCDTIKVPVSWSSSVLDRDGAIVLESRQLFKGRFEREYREWSTLWTPVDLNTIDLSEDINERVEELDGDAAVRLRCQVCSTGSASSRVIWLNMLPFWIGAVKVKVDADVVQVTPSPPFEAPAEGSTPHEDKQAIGG